jgi:ATP-dependent helicase STH1/SNF2
LEDGEDLQELSERTKEKKERRLNNKLLKEAEASARGTPVSDDSRGRKVKKGKNKVEDYSLGSKRKRGQKSMSVTPSIAEDEDDDHDPVRRFSFFRWLVIG